jgi:hypothetical protein
VTQGVGPEFKPQYHQKQKQKKNLAVYIQTWVQGLPLQMPSRPLGTVSGGCLALSALALGFCWNAGDMRALTHSRNLNIFNFHVYLEGTKSWDLGLLGKCSTSWASPQTFCLYFVSETGSP